MNLTTNGKWIIMKTEKRGAAGNGLAFHLAIENSRSNCQDRDGYFCLMFV